MRTLKVVRLVVCAVMVLFGYHNAFAESTQISMGCGPASAAGYPAGVALANFLNKKVPDIKLIPIELGSTAAMRRLSTGEMDTTYGNAYDMVGVYTNTGAFEKQPMQDGTQPYQAIWFWPVIQFMVTRTDTNIYSYDDLKGKNISLGSPKEGLYAFGKAAFNALGLVSEWNEKIVSPEDRSQVLGTKSVDAITAVCVAHNTLAGHTMELELYNKLRALKMTKEQEQIIDKTPGFSFTYVPGKLFKNDMGMEQIPAVANAYGWCFSRKTSADAVYKFVKGCFENAAELKELARTFESFSSNPKEVVLAGLKSTSTIVPVHPGAARYYKEIGLWQESWIEGK